MEGLGGKTGDSHCISSVVDRRFVFGDAEREKFRVFLRMQENFSDCRVLASMLRHRVRYFTDGTVPQDVLHVGRQVEEVNFDYGHEQVLLFEQEYYRIENFTRKLEKFYRFDNLPV